jgi:hypothetical protein
MKSDKRRKLLTEKKQRKLTAVYKAGKGNSRYALKFRARRTGYYSDTSPLRFGADTEE